MNNNLAVVLCANLSPLQGDERSGGVENQINKHRHGMPQPYCRCWWAGNA